VLLADEQLRAEIEQWAATAAVARQRAQRSREGRTPKL